MNLTINRREIILRRIIEHSFDGRKAALKKRENDLAKSLRSFCYGEELCSVLDGLPPKTVKSTESFYVSVDGKKVVLFLMEPVLVPDWHNFSYADARVRLTSDTPYGKKLDQLLSDKLVFQTDKKTKMAEVQGVLENFNTMKSLLKAWPEIAEFTADLAPPEKTAVPAPLIVNLNSQLGLAAPGGRL